MNNAYTQELEDQIYAWVKKRQSNKRFAHTQRVVETITQLAERWSPHDVRVCRLAAWLHDAAKHYSDEKLYDLAMRYGVEISTTEEKNPMLLHGIVAYHKAAKKFGLDDPQIRTACAYHTTGSPQMNLVDKLLFLADLIEPAREFPLVGTLRELAFVHIDKAMLLAIDGTLRHLLTKHKMIDPRVILLYNVLLEKEYPR